MIKFMNNVNYVPQMKVIKPQGKDVMNLDDEIQKLTKTITERAEAGMSDTFGYGSIDESLRNETDELFCKAFGLSIEQVPDEKSRHFLILHLLHPSMRTEPTRTLTAGSKKEILEYLKDKSFLNTLKSNLRLMSEELQNK